MMVSTLWSACAEGDFEKVTELLNQGSQVDLEARDHNGNTPLIEAAKNGKIEVVRLLLDKGADPTNASSQGLPEQYTTDPVILALLTSARNKMAAVQSTLADATYPQDSNLDVTKTYYPPPPGPYYYPGMPMPPPMLPDGPVPFYPHPPHPGMPDMSGAGIGNLPPPEIARMIPCRYYPACRYGASCMFAHPPPQGPYLSGPMPPPAQYPAPYDGVPPASYPPTYYSVPSPSFQPPPNGVSVHSVSPTLSPGASINGPPHPPMAPAGPGGEMVSPVQPNFSAGMPPPMPYGVPGPLPYGPGGPMPMPVSHPGAVPPSPQVMYPPTSPVVSTAAPYAMPPAYMGQPYPPPPVMPNGTQTDAVTSPISPSVNPQPDYYVPGHRESFSHHKRGNGRRPSFGVNRKPPCLFFPMGKCKNGDECRFPHILPDGSVPQAPNHFSGRGVHRPRPSISTNGVTGLEEKFASLSTQENERPRQDAQPAANGTNGGSASNGSSRSQSTEPGSRGRGYQGYKSNQFANGRTDKKPAAQKPQRLPSADEFPVLAGAQTPPLRSPGAGPNGWIGPTAAQVLQAPPPPRKDSQPGTRGGSPENGRPAQTPQDSKPEINGAPSPVQIDNNKLALSYSAAAAPEAVKEVAVSA